MKKLIIMLIATCLFAAVSFGADWTVGTNYKINDEVQYGSQNYLCTFAHTAVEGYYPGAEGIWFWQLLDQGEGWVANKRYKVGDEVSYNNTNYVCVFAHTSRVNWFPGAPGLWFWEVKAEEQQAAYAAAGTTTEWAVNVLYDVEAEVTYNGKEYKCIYAHTSQSNWFPGADGIWFWQELAPDNAWVPNKKYKVGDVVSYNGAQYECNYAHRSLIGWNPGAPGIYFWDPAE
jgi:chitodextrinase